MRFLEVFGQHTFYYAAEFLEGTVVIKNANDSDGGSYSFEVQDDGDILTTISSSSDLNWFTLNSTQGSSADGNDPYRAPALIFSKTATDVDGQKEGAIFFGSSSIGGSVASIVGWHHDVSDFEGAIQLAVKTESGSSGSTPYTFADWHGSEVHIGGETNYAAGNVIKGYANGAGIVNVDLGIGASSTTTIAGTLTMGSTAFVNNSGVVQVATQGTIDHDSLANFVAAEHYDWSSDISSTATIHANNITDLHGAGVDGAANQLLTDDGDGTVTSESTLTWDGSMLTVFSDGDANEPVVKIHARDNTAPLTAGELRFDSDRGDTGVGGADDVLGTITWRGHDDQSGGSAAETIYASVVGLIQDPSNTNEDGKLEFNVLNQNVSNTGLLLSPSGVNGHVNATIGKGTVGIVTIEGFLNLGGHNVNDIDITSEASDANDHLMTALAIKNRIEDYGLTSSGLALSSATSDLPSITLTNSNTDANPSVFTFQKTATGANDDVIGNINFTADNDADEVITYARISGGIASAVDTDEAGHLNVYVATSDGISSIINRTGLALLGSATGNAINANIGYGTASVTTIAGELTVVTEATIPSRKFTITGNTDGEYQGDVVYFGGTTSMTAGRIYHYKSDGTWELADPGDVSTSDGLLAVALGAASDTNGMLLRGMVTMSFDPGSVGDVLYLSLTAGRCEAAVPSGNEDIVRVVGYCLNASNGQIWFNPDNTFVEITA